MGAPLIAFKKYFYIFPKFPIRLKGFLYQASQGGYRSVKRQTGSRLRIGAYCG